MKLFKSSLCYGSAPLKMLVILLNRHSGVCCTMKMSYEQTFYEHLFSQGTISVHIRANIGTKPQHTVTFILNKSNCTGICLGSKAAFIIAIVKEKRTVSKSRNLGSFHTSCVPPLKRKLPFQPIIFQFSHLCGLCGSSQFQVSSAGRWHAYE